MENNLSNKKITTIVYCTLNLKNGKIYIGVHDVGPEYPKFDGYIGNMVNVFHPKTIDHPKEPFQYAVKKYGFNAFKRITLKECESREEALEWEQILVDEDFLARNDVYNITLGGGAPPVKKIPVYQYDLEGNFINSYTSIIEASLIVKTSPNSIRNACNHKRVSADSYWSYDKIDKLDTTEHIKPQRQPVYVYNQDGNFIYKYKSLSECIKNDHIDLYTLKTCLIKQVSYNDKYYSKLKMDVFVKRDVKRHDQWPIYQYDLKGNFIKEYKNIGEAARELKCGSSNISRAIKQGLTAVGYQWSWEKLPYMRNNEFQPHSGRPIAQYTLDGELVKKYRTIREAKNSGFGNVQHVLDGRATQTKGYTFRYLDEDKLKI